MTSNLSVLYGLIAVLLSYLAGSLPFAVIVSRIMGLQDPRTFGSKNPGATNVLRTGNKKAAILTLLGDMAKGLVAVCAVKYAHTHWHLPDWSLPLAALAVFLGHLYPVFLRFKGGKGVATALGVLLGVSPWLGLATAATWLIVAYATRYSSLAALLAAVFAPLYHIFGSNVAWERNTGLTLVIVVIAALLISRHSANIQRLIQGKESRIGQKKTPR